NNGEDPIRLDCAWCFVPYGEAARIASLPALRKGHVTFGVVNHFAAVTAESIELWAHILHRVPSSHLRLHGIALRSRDIERRVRQAFVDRGIAWDRIELVADAASDLRSLAGYAEIDIALDTFPCPGMLATCEALWMGIPVITLAGS